ncbi:hypothetical protein [Peribacillus sp. SI8-4]|uniref:hypothetical protein n=1 Tax=Peribacillus sp. SI8-4 TaxID=3048009 RepID=UPI00255652EB|nr:hypothetical protein [Peribacillus sp. SI8-4]
MGVEQGEYIAFGNDANAIAMFQHAMYSVMIGENMQLTPFSSEKLSLCGDTEDHIVQRLMELGELTSINKPVNV